MQTSNGLVTFEITDLIGYGGGCAAYQACLADGRPCSSSENIVIKFFRNEDDYSRERAILRYLKNHKYFPETFGDNRTLRALAMPMYEPAEPSMFTDWDHLLLEPSDLEQLYDALKILHQAGIFHCDIRLANIAFDGFQLKLLDFGFAQLTEATRTQLKAPANIRNYCGSIETASNRILDMLAADRETTDIIVGLLDELESMMKMYVLSQMDATRKDAIIDEVSNKNYGKLARLWQQDPFIRGLLALEPTQRLKFLEAAFTAKDEEVARRARKKARK